MKDDQDIDLVDTLEYVFGPDNVIVVDENTTFNFGVKYPNITVQLTGKDGNAFAIMGRVTLAMRRSGISSEEIDQFHKEATSGDYDNLLHVCTKWVNVK